jgi:tetratricopeptide (TPR) repeat protein
MTTGDPQSLEQQVWTELKRGDVQKAIAACERLNRDFPDFASGWHTASQLALKLGNASMALDAVREALKMRPDYTSWVIQEARCLAKLGRTAEVRVRVDRLMDTRINSAYENSALGMLLTELGEREAALVCYQRAVSANPADARHYYNVASLQRTLGQLQEAEANFNTAIELNPGDYEAYKLRSELRTQTKDENHVFELEAVLEEGLADKRGEANICYALAKELEDLHEPERSFQYLQRGARSRRSNMRYDPQRDLETIAAIREAFKPQVFADAAPGDDTDEPIFVLGMPRTGSTLVERILSAHTDVFAAGELNNFAVELMRLLRSHAGEGQQRDDLVRGSVNLDFGALGNSYLQSTRPFTGHTAKFIDKMPLNFLYVGLIHLALPNARIINVRRDPMDTCYAVFKTLFVDAYPFSYDLEELAHYYVAYDGLMKHWDNVLPGVVCHVDYEALVTDVETESRKIVERCGLQWQSRCLRFHESTEASTTASAVQVRQPVYRSSVNKWRDYERQLQPVVDILRQAGIVTSDLAGGQ